MVPFVFQYLTKLNLGFFLNFDILTFSGVQGLSLVFLSVLSQVTGFLQGIRDAVKQVPDQSTNTPATTKENASEESSIPRNNSSPNLPVDANESVAVVFPLWYVGRVMVSHRQAPPTLIDELVERFNKRMGMNDLEKQLKSRQDEQNESTVINTEKHVREHHLAKKANSLDIAEIMEGRNHSEEKTEGVGEKRPQLLRVNSNSGGRPRSASDGDKTKEIYSSKTTNSSQNQQHLKTHSRNSSFSNVGENRNILFKISIQSVSCLSVSTKVQLMERRLKEVSFCQQVCTIAIVIG